MVLKRDNTTIFQKQYNARLHKSCQFLIGMVLKHIEIAEDRLQSLVSIPHRYGT